MVDNDNDDVDGDDNSDNDFANHNYKLEDQSI